MTVSALPTLLADATARHAGERALGVVGVDDDIEWITFEQLDRMVGTLSAGLSAVGVGPGDMVAGILGPRLEWVLAAQACLRLGATWVPISLEQAPQEWAFIVADSGAVVCLTDTCLAAERALAGHESRAAPCVVIHIGAPVAGALEYEHVTDMGHGTGAVPLRGPEPESIAMLTYIPGYRDGLRGVLHTHRGLLESIAALAERLPLRVGDRSLCVPSCDVFLGGVALHLLLAAGVGCVICRDHAQVMDQLERVAPTVLFGPPAIWQGLHARVHAALQARPRWIQSLTESSLQLAIDVQAGRSLSLSQRLGLEFATRLGLSPMRQVLGGRLRLGLCVGQSLAGEFVEPLQALGVDVRAAYDVEEFGGIATLQAVGACQAKSLGQPLQGVRVTIERIENGDTKNGGIILHGPSAMAGYHNHPACTKKARAPDGGLYTSDLGYVDAEGHLYRSERHGCYRLDTGKWVCARAVEDALVLNQYIDHAFVVGDNRAYNVALIILQERALLAWARAQGIEIQGEAWLALPEVLAKLEQEIELACRGFAPHQRITRFVADARELTPENGLLTQTWMVRRSRVIARYYGALEALYNSSAPPR